MKKIHYKLVMSEKETDALIKLFWFGAQMASYILGKIKYLKAEKTTVKEDENSYSAHEAITSAKIWKSLTRTKNRLMQKITSVDEAGENHQRE